MVNISLKGIELFDKESNEFLLNNISLDIKAGEFISLVGAVNNGKSRMLRIIAGLSEPNSGTVLFNGKVLSEFSPNYSKLAMVFRSQALYPHLTVRKNLEFGLKIANIPKETIDARIAEIEDLLSIENIMDLKPWQLSSSQKQLAAIARAFVKRPEILILDEPISELDANLKIKIQSIIKRYCINLQATVIYATHNPSEAMTLSDRLVCLEKGVLQQIGTSDELYNKPANEIVARFIGYPEMNFIDYEAKENNHILNFINADCSVQTPQILENIIGTYPKAKIGIRAENISIVPEKPNAIPMIVEMQEYSGSQSIIYVSKEHQTLSVEVPPNKRYELGETVYVEPKENGIHIFANGKLVL